jgi:hypothetical protein
VGGTLERDDGGRNIKMFIIKKEGSDEVVLMQP